MTYFDSVPRDSVRPRLLRQWVTLLTGPVVWAIHFFTVYLLTEAVCGLGDASLHARWSSTTIAILAVTVLGALACVWGVVGAWKLWRVSPDADGVDGFMAPVGIMLGSVFTVAILFVGLPALVLSPC